MKKIVAIQVFILCLLLVGCNSASIGVIGGADGPTAIFVGENDHKWGLALRAEDVTDKGLTIIFEQYGEDLIGELSTGSWYILETMVDGEWQGLEPKVDNTVWNSMGYRINKYGTTEHKVNWETLYGKLEPGHYRISKEVIYVRSAGDYDKDLYKLQFYIPTNAQKINTSEVLTDIFVFDKDEIEKIEVVYPGDGDPYGCYIDKDDFFEIADTVKLEPNRRIDKLDSNNGILIVAVNNADERVSVWMDSRGAVGCSQFEASSAVTTQYDISRSDYIKLYSFLPEEATAHIPLENPYVKYIWIVGAVVVLVFILGFAVGIGLKKQ